MQHRPYNWRLALVLWLISLPGVVVATVSGLPMMLQSQPLPAPLPVIMLAAGAQSAVVLAIAAWVGTALAPRVRLRSPILEALVSAQPVPRLAPLAFAGLMGGVLGAALLLVLARLTPPALAAVQETLAMPLSVRVLYGGVAEEVLVRWGLMSACLWAFWRIGQRTEAPPGAIPVAMAIGASALVFGLGHLPAVAALVPDLDAGTVAYVVAGNGLFGLVAGYLCWRHGLESAIAAHVLAHLLGFVARG